MHNNMHHKDGCDKKSFLKTLLFAIVRFLFFKRGTKVKGMKKVYLINKKLKTIKNGFKGNKFQNGVFENPYGKSGNTAFFDLLKWKLSPNPQKDIKENEKYSLKVIKNKNALSTAEDFIYWLGHASFLIQLDGKKILTDPCLTAPPFIKRLTELPIEIEKIKPDYLLISHGHYDHLDLKTIEKFDKCIALVPLKMGQMIESKNEKISTQEAGWYQQYDINEKFEITFLPAHHWHKRGINDYNEMLWGSFVIQTKDKTIYFAGDTGYSNHFRDIQKIFKKVDIAIMPIGAYSPGWFMKSSHINPQETLQASRELHASKVIPMHFGTFDLSDEPLGEPERLLRGTEGNENVHFLAIGEKWTI